MNLKMTVYALRHKSTGLYMPSRMGRTSRAGWSHWEPLWQHTPQHKPHDTNPRIFFSEKSARNAQAMWEAGAWGRVYEPLDFSIPNGFVEEVGLAPSRGIHPRAKGDLEIVLFSLNSMFA